MLRNVICCTIRVLYALVVAEVGQEEEEGLVVRTKSVRWLLLHTRWLLLPGDVVVPELENRTLVASYHAQPATPVVGRPDVLKIIVAGGAIFCRFITCPVLSMTVKLIILTLCGETIFAASAGATVVVGYGIGSW